MGTLHVSFAVIVLAGTIASGRAADDLGSHDDRKATPLARSTNRFSWNSDNAASVEIRGRVTMQPDGRALFRTESGALVELAQTRHAAAIFVDTNVQAKTLALRGEWLTNANQFRVTKPLHSIESGKLYDLHYYCDVCAIDQVEPGACMCCREDVRLVEAPIPWTAPTNTAAEHQSIPR